MLTKEEIEQKSQRDEQSSFDRWMDRAETRFIISTIPPGDHKESLTVLLRSAFAAGTAHGAGNFAVMMLDGLMRDQTKRGGT